MKNSKKAPYFIVRPILQPKSVFLGGMLIILGLGIEFFTSFKAWWLFPAIFLYIPIYLGNIFTYYVITDSSRAQKYDWRFVQCACYAYFGLISTIIVAIHYYDLDLPFWPSLVFGAAIGQGGWMAFRIVKGIFDFLRQLSARQWGILLFILLIALIAGIWIIQGESPIQIEIHANAIEICIQTPTYKPGVNFNPCIDIPFVFPKPKSKPEPTTLPPTVSTEDQSQTTAEICNRNSTEIPKLTIKNLAPDPLTLTLNEAKLLSPIHVPGARTVEIDIPPGTYLYLMTYAAPDVLPLTGVMTISRGCNTWKFWYGMYGP